MDARRIVIVGRFGHRWLWCMLGLMFALGPGAASAQGNNRDPCNGNSHWIMISDCQNQVQAPVSFNALETKGWAFYCTGDHPYFYAIDGAWSIDNSNVSGSGFSGIENPSQEGTDTSSGASNKMDANFTNWALEQSDLVVTLACADSAP